MLHTGTGLVKRAMQILMNLIIANLQIRINFTGSINRALTKMRFTIHTGITVSPFHIHLGRKPRTRLINLDKDNKSYRSEWAKLNVSVPRKQIPIYVARNEKRKVTDHIVMSRKRKVPFCLSHNSSKRRQVKPVSGGFQHQ